MVLLRRHRASLAVALGLVGVVAVALALAPWQSAGSAKTRAVPVQTSSLQNQHPTAGNFKPDHTSLASCNDEQCYEQAFGNVAYYRGPKAALQLFADEIQRNHAISAGCHPIAHWIGSASLARFRGNVPEAFGLGSSICWSGYYHGILEHAFAGATTKTQLAAIARRVCASPLVRRTTFLAYQCVHGLGHGLMLQTAYDLPLALQICDRLGTHWDRQSCTSGVFMENVNGAITTAYGFRTPWVRDKDLVYPCDWVASRYKLYCYLMVTSRVLAANGYDWRATAAICRGVERGWVDTCFQSYGRDASGSTNRDVPRVLALCRRAGSGERECLYGAARDMVSNDAGPRRAARLCAGAPSRFRGRCVYGIGTIVGGLQATEGGRRALCSTASDGDLRDCLRGAGVIA